ncbi:hypothetical protein DFR58_13633 [Anaerobacterium chartisolvens]|uniref:DUF4181 domain-containing protein n=1 Tax=Anaerobacterium chartisolvens TaxID=1297424 RepID=A0A369AMF0_9FIRM|nr:hypothetical protein [Anaerobacterium chartisolvens]RCX09357.1 hypothetical protein DFR58_13633 [Anaerobacterium chartisolvens]
MDIIIIIGLTFIVVCLTIDTINKYRKNEYSTSIFKRSRKDKDYSPNKDVKKDQFISLFFILCMLFIKDNKLKTGFFVMLTTYAFIFLNTLNIMTYKKTKDKIIIRDSFILNGLLIFILVLVFIIFKVN